MFPADLLSSSNQNHEDGYSNFFTQNTSPHPPPRQRHLNHKAQNQTQPPCSPLNSSRTRTNTSMNSSGGSNFRNKISFKDLHTFYGRPVLRDRNEWRYNKRAGENACSAPTSLIDTDFPINRQQNVLISL